MHNAYTFSIHRSFYCVVVYFLPDFLHTPHHFASHTTFTLHNSCFLRTSERCDAEIINNKIIMMMRFRAAIVCLWQPARYVLTVSSE